MTGERLTMRLVASLSLVALWIAIVFAALLISSEPGSDPFAERGDGSLRELAVAEAPSRDGAAVGEADEAAAPAPADADTATVADAESAEEEGPEEEEAEEVFSEAELESPDFSDEPLGEEQAERAGDQSAPGELAAALPRGRDQPVADGGSLELEPQVGRPVQKIEDILSDRDAGLYREIFQLQGAGRWNRADVLIAQLENRLLLGHVLAQRFLHPTAYRSEYKELLSWLANYADHPGADKIYKLAMKKRPRGGFLPREPRVHKSSLGKLGPITKPPYKSKKRLTREERRRVRNLRARMYRQVNRLQLTATEELIASEQVQRLFDHVQLDEATSWVAAGWFYYGKYQMAATLAEAAARRSGDEVPLAHWIAGLAAWRLHELPVAALHFEALALSPEHAGWNDAAGPFWAARVHEKLGHADKVENWLRRAAAHPRTLYGLMARHRLGLDTDFDFAPLKLDARRIAALGAKPAGARALAFLKLGDHRQVEKELNALEGWQEPAVAEAIMAVAEAAQLPALSLRIALRLAADPEAGWHRSLLDAALYPIPPWQPESGFKLDRALIYAVIRQESQFKSHARSRDGARGLMQLLPSTARGLSKSHRFRGAERAKLYNPELNMELGQRYLSRLLDLPYIDGDIFRMATAYNGGPGNLRSWSRKIQHDDPLIFIESIPVRETREFIKHVVTNLWIYRLRLQQDAPSLAHAALGGAPRYTRRDGLVLEAQRPPEESGGSFWSWLGFD